MKTTDPKNQKATNYRWVICAMLFFATTVNYLDRQVLSLTWADFIGPQFHWTNAHYGLIGAFFSGFYALAMFFAGKFVDWLDTKKGFLWSIGVWSVGACLHAFCGIATTAWVGVDPATLDLVRDAKLVETVINVSVIMFIFARIVLAVGEAGNFPASIKATAEYFPKKDRAFATSIFNAGAQIGALLAPVSIPLIARAWGWEASFVIIGALGFVWMGFWVFVYKKPENNPRVNAAELEYILQDGTADEAAEKPAEEAVAEKPAEKPLTYAQAFGQRQTWAFAVGKFLTDGVWWFYLLWAPAYLKSVYDMPSYDPRAMAAIFVLYLVSMLSLIGGKLPTFFIVRRGMDPYAGRMRSMLIFAFFPLLALMAQPLGHISYWVPVLLIAVAAAAHQAWSANIFSTVGDMFPKSSIATITGIGGAAGGLGSVVLQFLAGRLFDHTESTGMRLLGAEGIESGYMIMFSYCAVAYILGWIIMKSLVPRFRPVII